MSMRARLLFPLLLAPGCAFDAGEGFAVLEPTVRAAYTSPASREAGDGYQRLSSDFQLRLTTARVRLEKIDLLGSSGGGGPTAFDPANPPPGYTICHNGHCDRDDGAQVSYEDVAAELGGGGATATTVATLPVGELDLLAPETRAVECQPDCELPQTTVSNGRWTLTAVRLEGSVRDSRATPRFSGERPFRFEVTSASTQAEPAAVITGTLDVPSDRENAPRVLLDLTLELTPASFDAIDWAAASPGAGGVVDLNTNTTTRTQLLKAISELAPKAEVKREDR
jgi:hypothetical protein